MRYALHRALAPSQSRTILAAKVVGLSLCLSACVSFIPNYDAAIYKRLDAATSEIDKIGTAVALPYRQPAFSEVEPYYINALSNLQSAEDMAAGRDHAYAGRIPHRAASLVTQAITICRTALEELRELHRTQGLKSADFRDSKVPRTCTIPKMMESRLQRS